jgi:hypothetical protein
MFIDWRSRHFAFRGRAGKPPRRCAPAGSPQPRTPAGVFVPSAPIKSVVFNLHSLTHLKNTLFAERILFQ